MKAINKTFHKLNKMIKIMIQLTNKEFNYHTKVFHLNLKIA